MAARLATVRPTAGTREEAAGDPRSTVAQHHTILRPPAVAVAIPVAVIPAVVAIPVAVIPAAVAIPVAVIQAGDTAKTLRAW
jgi:hypothetical protein